MRMKGCCLSLFSVISKASLYAHYPLCEHVCSYCDFNVYSRKGDLERARLISEEWVGGVIRDLDFLLEGNRVKLESFYLGGGTPSLLPADQLHSLMEGIRSRVSLLEGREMSIEMNPESVSEEFLEAALQCGFNRISLGVQSFQSQQLKRLERLATLKNVENALRLIRDRFSNTNIDLMIGLPDQSLDDLKRDLLSLLEWDPPHVSIYVLGLVEGHKWLRSDFISSRLPNEDKISEFYRVCDETLSLAGYHHYEVSNFAKPGFESCHNRRYWDVDCAYLGVGPGAHGHRVQGRERLRYEMIREPRKWLSATEPISWTECLSEEQDQLERLYLSLRSGASLEVSRFDASRIKALEESGAIVLDAQGGFSMQRSHWVMLDAVVNALL